MNNRIGSVYINSQGQSLKIIEYMNNKNCTVKFESGEILTNQKFSAIESGMIKNHFCPSVYGIGFVGKGNYLTSINGKFTKSYSIWKGIIKRCYDKKYQENHSEYIGCSVSSEWWNFQTFSEWYNRNYITNYHLDKDILIKGNKIYSSTTCCFVPSVINTVLTLSKTARGDYPLGVCKSGNKYIAQLNLKIGNKRTRKYLGSFINPESAFYAYKQAKEQYIKQVAKQWKDKISIVVYDILMNYEIKITD